MRADPAYKGVRLTKHGARLITPNLNAVQAVRSAEEGMVEALRKLFAARVERCSPRCKGWFIDGDRLYPVRCDECASLNAYIDHVDDWTVAVLPEAQRAMRDEYKRAGEAGRIEDPGVILSPESRNITQAEYRRLLTEGK